MVAMDDKWEGLLNEITKHEGAINEDNMKQIMMKIKVDEDAIPKIKKMLYLALLHYTTSDAQVIVKSKGAGQSIETFKYLHTKGKHDTTMNVLRLMNKTMHPESASSQKNVEAKINKWKEYLMFLT